jgi:hypothetical protein
MMLRLAEQFERSRSGRVRDLEAEIEKDRVRIVLLAPEEPVVEMSEAAKHAPIFERVFGRPLELDWRRTAGPRKGAEARK